MDFRHIIRHTLHYISPVLATLSLGVLAAGCGDTAGADVLQGQASELCSTGTYWTGGERGSTKMIPGGNCIGCHRDRGEGPRYTAAGTVFGQPGDEESCFGIEAVTVNIVDARGKEVTMFTNKAGNFYTRESLTPPYRASITHKGQTIAMESEISDFNCANCHTAEGLEGAAGRIFIP